MTRTSTPSPTSAQRRLLEAATRHRQGRLIGGDPRTRQVLIDRLWVELDGYHFGPLFKITALGCQAVADDHGPADAPQATVNWWARGYHAAMSAGAPGEFDDVLRASGEHTDHQRSLFLDGWRSVWRCERAQEADALGEAWAAAQRTAS